MGRCFEGLPGGHRSVGGFLSYPGPQLCFCSPVQGGMNGGRDGTGVDRTSYHPRASTLIWRFRVLPSREGVTWRPEDAVVLSSGVDQEGHLRIPTRMTMLACSFSGLFYDSKRLQKPFEPDRLEEMGREPTHQSGGPKLARGKGRARVAYLTC